MYLGVFKSEGYQYGNTLLKEGKLIIQCSIMIIILHFTVDACVYIFLK